jgi:hypothetical protein
MRTPSVGGRDISPVGPYKNYMNRPREAAGCFFR